MFGCVWNGAGTIDISILTDNYGSETTWEIVDEAGNVLGSGGPYNNTTQYNETAYVGANTCFEFKLYDSYGDGMCCQQGVGSVLVTDQSNNIIFEGTPVNLQSFTELSAYFETGMASSNSWECTPFGCADVGIGLGTYSTQLDCESDPNTGCYIATNINEIKPNNIEFKVYNVLGIEVDNIKLNTIYIINGKKIIKFK